MRSIHKFLLLGSILSFFSCRELYTPELKELQEVLVVDGMITDQPGPYQLVLSKSNPFNHTGGVSTVSGAEAFLTDQGGNPVYYLEDDSLSGYYYTPAEFQALPGSTYTLHITTPDQLQYKSGPQELLALTPLDTLYGKEEKRSEVFEDTPGVIEVESTEGAGLLVDIPADPEEDIPSYRIETTGYVQYRTSADSPFGPIVLYCWKKLFSNDIQLTGTDLKVNSASLTGRGAGFLPFGKRFFGLGHKDMIENFGVLLTQYRLNKDSYEYYQNVKELMDAEGKLFDPAPSQLKGNIHCLSDPDKLVLGFFEASSKATFGFGMTSLPGEGPIAFKRTVGLEYLTGISGCDVGTHPYWIK